MNATATKQITYVTPEGFVVRTEDDGVIGFKCLNCSTTHIADENLTVDQFVDYISMCQETHAHCH